MNSRFSPQAVRHGACCERGLGKHHASVSDAMWCALPHSDSEEVERVAIRTEAERGGQGDDDEHQGEDGVRNKVALCGGGRHHAPPRAM